MAGAVFTLFTVNTNVSEALDVPSLTVTVIVALPVWPAAGVTVTVRFEPLPPNTMFAFGTRVVLEELPVTVRFVACVSGSPMVNGIAGVGVFTMVVLFVMSLMTGGDAVGP